MGDWRIPRTSDTTGSLFPDFEHIPPWRRCSYSALRSSSRTFTHLWGTDHLVARNVLRGGFRAHQRLPSAAEGAVRPVSLVSSRHGAVIIPAMARHLSQVRPPPASKKLRNLLTDRISTCDDCRLASSSFYIDMEEHWCLLSFQSALSQSLDILAIEVGVLKSLRLSCMMYIVDEGVRVLEAW